MSSILATVSTTVSAAHSTNRVAGDRRTAHNRTHRRRSRLFHAPCYLFVFSLPPAPIRPAFSTRRNARDRTNRRSRKVGDIARVSPFCFRCYPIVFQSYILRFFCSKRCV